MAGERSKGKEGSEQDGVGKSPLEDDLRNLVKEIQKDNGERSIIFDEEIHLLEEEDNDVDEDQAAQAQAEDIQILPDDISMENTVTFKHLLQETAFPFR
jgi:hypothetical protein